MSKHRNPDIVRTERGFERKGAMGRPVNDKYEEQNNFFRCYHLVHEMTIESLQRQLWKLGWPYGRVVIRVLEWEEAVERLKDDAKAMLAMCRMVVAIEDPEGRLYVVRTPDIVTGTKGVHKTANKVMVQAAVDTLN